MNPHFAFADFFDQGKLNPFLSRLSQKMAAGNVCLDIHAARKDSDEYALPDLSDAELLRHPLVGSEKDLKPFILHQNKLYLQRYFQYETHVIRCIQNMISEDDTAAIMQNLINQSHKLTSLFPQKNNETTDWQMIAAISALLHRFHIITGGPGTGKTTSVSKLLALILEQQPHTRILLAAPTGKAAVRMTESLGKINSMFEREGIHVSETTLSKIRTLKPTTIHAMLGYNKGSIYFKHNATNPLPAEIVIADECSMIDMALFAKLLDAIGPHTKLILLGDKNQLSSVEAGSLFGDLCAALPEEHTFSESYGHFLNHFTPINKQYLQKSEGKYLLSGHITELQHSHRFSDAGGIGKFSKAIIRQDLKTIHEFLEQEDEQVKISSNQPQQLLASFAEQYAAYIQCADAEMALTLINNIKILCALKQGAVGVYKANIAIEQHLAHQKLINPNTEFYENRLIMVNRNQPEIGLYNGDTGILRTINGVMRACFLNASGQLFSVLPAQIESMETAFAMTIHKSQGSEYDAVMILLPPTEASPILTRELLYTAVTRARKKVIISAPPAVVLSTVQKGIDRVSGIINRINS